MKDIRNVEQADLSRESMGVLLDRAAKLGMTGLTLWKTTQGWQANFQINREGWHVCTHPDPAVAVYTVLSQNITIEEILMQQAVTRLHRALKRLGQAT